MAAAVVVAFMVWAVIQVILEPKLPLLLRIVWIYVLIQLPLIGAFVWFVFGRDINRRLAAGLR